MIKIFRKVRQQLLAGNKFSQYMLYAIGEIILVVIGILIALQINNWNEDRIDRNIETRVLTNILADLISNEEIFQSVEIQIDKQILQTKQFLDIMAEEPQDSSW
jgi:sensor domain CHASE-containing protein